jgi:hypothetical protein
MRQVALRHWFLGIVPLEIKGRMLPSDAWAWSPLVLSGVPGDPSGKYSAMLGMLHMIPDVGLEQSLPHTTSISRVV